MEKNSESKKNKMKAKGSNRQQISKNIPLSEQLLQDNTVRSVAREKKRKRQLSDDEFVGSKESKKILKQAKDQLNELEGESESSSLPPPKLVILGGAESGIRGRDGSESEDSDDDDDEDDQQVETYEEESVPDEELEKVFSKFLPTKDTEKRNLADIVMEAIAKKQAEICTQASDTSMQANLSEDVVNLFRSAGQILRHHRSGPLPKALKKLPNYAIWQQLLELMEPEQWSAAAVRDVNRIFVSNLKEPQAAKYMNIVLLPRIRDDIREFKKLNDHLYGALKKCMFKSYGFVKGILLPLCKAGDCTNREATIISSILAKSKMKTEHSAIAISEICEMPYSCANCIFLTTLLDKKHALPYSTVDDVVNHFMRFERDKRTKLTVLWHQCLLTFAQRYKHAISTEQKEALLRLIKIHKHKDISPEVRRELTNAPSQDVEMEEPVPSGSMMMS